MKPPRWAIFLSGRGSNAQALGELLAELDVALCVSSKKNSLGLKRARQAGIPTVVMSADFSWDQVHLELQMRRVNRIFLLGFMKILPARFCEKWSGKIWNLHPSLLPDFPGQNAIEKSFEAGGAMGVSVHEVTAEMDAGPLRLQRKISDQGSKEFSLSEAQFRISVTEQILVRTWAQRCNQVREGEWT